MKITLSRLLEVIFNRTIDFASLHIALPSHLSSLLIQMIAVKSKQVIN